MLLRVHVKVASEAQLDPSPSPLAQLREALLYNLRLVGIVVAGVRECKQCGLTPSLIAICAIVQTKSPNRATHRPPRRSDECGCRSFGSRSSAPWHAQRVASASIIDAKIFQPSDEPSSFSLDRSGCGIIPRTFRPSFRIPAILLREPFGLASGVISPAGVAVAKGNPILGSPVAASPPACRSNCLPCARSESAAPRPLSAGW